MVSVTLSVTVDIFLVVSGCLSIYRTVSVSQSVVEASSDTGDDSRIYLEFILNVVI